MPIPNRKFRLSPSGPYQTVDCSDIVNVSKWPGTTLCDALDSIPDSVAASSRQVVGLQDWIFPDTGWQQPVPFEITPNDETFGLTTVRCSDPDGPENSGIGWTMAAMMTLGVRYNLKISALPADPDPTDLDIRLFAYPVIAIPGLNPTWTEVADISTQIPPNTVDWQLEEPAAVMLPAPLQNQFLLVELVYTLGVRPAIPSIQALEWQTMAVTI